MTTDTKLTRKASAHARFVLPLAALLGAGALGLWSVDKGLLSEFGITPPSFAVPHVVTQAPLSKQEQSHTQNMTQTKNPVQPLRVIATQSLYMDEFKAPEILSEIWQETQIIASAKQPAPAHAKPTLLGRLLAPMAPVQTANASVNSPLATASTPKKAVAPKADASQKPQAKESETSALHISDTFGSGSLGQLTKLRAELEQLKMQVSIEETRSRLNQLRGQGTQDVKRLPMPSLEFPPIGLPSGTAASRASSVRLVSIHSVNGNYAATVNAGSGPQVVKVNDQVGEGRVLSITRDSVVISRAQGNETLSMQK